MADLATIGAFLTSVKTATEIAKAIKDLDATVEKAELKLKLADLLGSLADAKISASELQELLHEKQKEIDRLNEVLTLRGQVIKDGDAYFLKGADGQPSGEPFCVHCWESRKALFHLVHGTGPVWLCTHCKSTVFNYAVDLQHQRIV
jgi:hypothetical protein